MPARKRHECPCCGSLHNAKSDECATCRPRGNARPPLITQDRLQSLVSYNPDTGLFVNLANRGATAKAGEPFGKTNRGRHGSRYLQATIDGVPYQLHRLAWLYMNGAFPARQLDHINGNGLDNRIANLRECDQSENNENFSGKGRGSSSFLGVSYDKRRQRWTATVSKNGKRYYRYCKTEEEAIEARKELKKKHHVFNPVQRVAAMPPLQTDDGWKWSGRITRVAGRA